MPGPEELAPGWGSGSFTPEGQIQQTSMIASNARRMLGWRGRLAGIAVIVFLLLLVGLVVLPALFGSLGILK